MIPFRTAEFSTRASARRPEGGRVHFELELNPETSILVPVNRLFELLIGPI
jgi:hypothetical protein